MGRPRNIKTLEQTSIGANGFRLQLLIEKELFEVCHAYHNGKADVVDRFYFLKEDEAKTKFHSLVALAIQKQNEFEPQKSFPLITKTI